MAELELEMCAWRRCRFVALLAAAAFPKSTSACLILLKKTGKLIEKYAMWSDNDASTLRSICKAFSAHFPSISAPAHESSAVKATDDTDCLSAAMTSWPKAHQRWYVAKTHAHMVHTLFTSDVPCPLAQPCMTSFHTGSNTCLGTCEDFCDALQAH